MKGLFSILFLYFAASPCLSARITPQANPSFNIVNYGATGNGKTDDSQAFLKAWKDVCGATQGNPTLLIPTGKIFLSPPLFFQGPCKPSAITIMIEGSITVPRSVNAWKWPVGNDRGAWVQFSYINGLTLNGGGLLDGQRDPWWECFAKNRCDSPRAMSFHSCETLQLDDLTVINTPGGHIGVNGCNGSRFSGLHLVAPKDSPNTDGLGVSSSSNVVIWNSTMEVGDDCVVINGGSSFINITGIFCGPGHGISIGSLGGHGAHDKVEVVHVRNCTFTGSSTAARIKTWQEGSGYARKITYEDIVLVDPQIPVLIDQNYVAFSVMDAHKAVEVSDITFRNFRGTSAVVEAIQLKCDKVIGCSNIVLDQIQITSSDGKKTSALCQSAHGTSSPSNVPKVPCLLP